jgi:hypothetical protein
MGGIFPSLLFFFEVSMSWDMDLVDVLSLFGGVILCYMGVRAAWQWWSQKFQGRMAGRFDPSLLPIPEMIKGFRRTTQRWASPRYLEGMGDPVLDELLYVHARKAVNNRQRMWIRYKGIHKPELERTIEVYRADVDESIFAWCCLRQEPRIFQRDRVLAWCLLDERFYRDPLLGMWAEEEYPQGRDAIPWNRWRQMKSLQVLPSETKVLPYEHDPKIIG